MKKLLFLALSVHLAQAASDETFTQDLKDVGSQFAEPVVDTGSAIKEGTLAVAAYTLMVAEKVKDATISASKKTVNAAKDVAHNVAHSRAVESAQDVGGQIADRAKELSSNIKTSYQATTSAIKNTAQKVAKSEVVGDVKEVCGQVGEAAKDSAVAVKDATITVLAATKTKAIAVKDTLTNNVVAQDIKDVGQQLGEFPSEIAAFFKEIKNLF